MADIFVFPTEFRQATAGKQYPAICFEYHTKDRVAAEKVFLPMPPGLEISDSMQYDTINLGQIGDVVTKAISAATKTNAPGKADQAITAGAKAGYAAIKDKIESGNAAVLAQIAAAKLPVVGDEARRLVDFGTRQVIAPNSNTAFSNSNIRSFSFKFKMVARSAADSQQIKKIVNLFREKMYPEGANSNLILEYPGTWYISFLGNESARNVWIPAIYESYLTAFSSAYNSSTNMFHADDSPVEVDVTMSFQEVKALNRTHIEKLNQGRIE